MYQPHKMIKHTQIILWLLPTNCFSVFDHFERLALKGLRSLIDYISLMFAGIFTTFTGTFTGPVAFLAFKLILFFWLTVAALIFSSAVAGDSF